MNVSDQKDQSGFPTSESGAQREKLHELPYDLVPFQEMTDAYVRVAEYGARKYTPWNWSKGLSRVQLLGSLLRHTFAYLRGEEYDFGPNGSGLLHTDHIIWNAVTLCHNVHWRLEDGRRGEPPRAYKRQVLTPGLELTSQMQQSLHSSSSLVPPKALV